MNVLWILAGVGALIIIWLNRSKITDETRDEADTGGTGPDNERPDEPSAEEVISEAYRQAIDAPIAWLNTNLRAFLELLEFDNRNCGDDKFPIRQDNEAYMNDVLNRSINHLKTKHNTHYCISPDDFDWIWNYSRAAANVWEAHVAALDRHDVGCESGVRSRVEAWLNVLNQYSGVVDNLLEFYEQYGRQAEEIYGPLVNQLPLPPA